MSEHDDAAAELDRLAADPILRHTGARWRLHAQVHPAAAADALETAARYRDKDRALLTTYRALLSELLVGVPDDPLVDYCRWAIGHFDR